MNTYLYICCEVSNAEDVEHSSSHKKLRPKPVVIAEHPPEHVVPSATSSSKTDHASAAILGGNKDHLETKKRIEMMRSQHGDSWLQNHGAKMGTLSSQLTTSATNTIDEDSIKEITLTFGESDTTLRASTPLNPPLQGSTIQVRSSLIETKPNTFLSIVFLFQSDSSAYQTATDQDNTFTNTSYTSTDETTPVIPDHAADMELFFPKSTIDEPEPLSDPEDNEVTYIVTIESTQADLFLIVSDTNIREKDALTGR